MIAERTERMNTEQNDSIRSEIERSAETQNAQPDVMYISLSKAAKLWGKSKNTLSLDINKGKLQWVEHQGKRSLLMSQLAQLYGPIEMRTALVHTDRAGIERSENGERTGETTSLRAVLDAKDEQISMLKEQIDDLKSQRDDLKSQRDKWAKAYDEVRALPAPASEAPAAEAPPKRRKFLGLF